MTSRVLPVSFRALVLFLFCVGIVRGEDFPRIAVRNGGFVDKATGRPFVPLGANFYHPGGAQSGVSGHATFCPTVYDAASVEKMMTDLAAHGLNTIRTFQAYAVGAHGIVQTKTATELSPGYVANMINFLRAARRHNIHVIFTTDIWLPDSTWLDNQPVSGETAFKFDPAWNRLEGTNGFMTALPCVRNRANEVIALIDRIKTVDPDLLRVVLAWEIQNEAIFVANQEPLKSHPRAWKFAGKTYDLGTDTGAQSYMDNVVVQWCNFNVKAIQQADPEALVSLSVFPYYAVGRPGPNHLLEDETRDERIPARPAALLKSDLSYIDLHIYAAMKGNETFAQNFQHQVTSDECPALLEQARAAGKPILIGETGLPSHYAVGASERNGVRYNFDYHAGIPLLRDELQRLKAEDFAGVLVWHYGWAPAASNEAFPIMGTFPECQDLVRLSW